MDKQARIIYLDYLRILAMFLVVACHCFGESTGSPAIISILTYLEMPCIGLFIAVSGALLLPIKGSGETFLKKRLGKVIAPTIFWSILYMLIFGSFSLQNVLSLPFHQVGSGILWFMYTIIGLYLISPIISPWLEKVSKKQLELYLLLWCVSLCYPILGNAILINSSTTGILYYLSGYAGFFILGYYLSKYGISLKVSTILFISFLMLFAIIKILLPGLTLYKGIPYLSIFCAVSTVFYWTVTRYITNKIRFFSKPNFNNKVVLISNLIFGVYFVQIGLIKIDAFYKYSPEPYLLGYFIRVFFIFLIALIISYIISYIPLSQYIIGFRHKRKRMGF